MRSTSSPGRDTRNDDGSKSARLGRIGIGLVTLVALALLIALAGRPQTVASPPSAAWVPSSSAASLFGSPAAAAWQDDEEDEAEAPDLDRVFLKNGRKLSGKLLDDHEGFVILESYRGKDFVPKAIVERIERSADPKRLEVWTKYRKKASSEKEWRTLAKFCEKYDLLPERRECARALLAEEPDDADTWRQILGQAKKDDAWVSEQEVAALVKKGWTIAEGVLVEKSADEGDDSSAEPEATRRGREKKPERRIREEDHLAKSFEGDAKSLWLLLARSGFLAFRKSNEWDPVSYKSCKSFIEQLQSGGDYRQKLQAFFDENNLPTDWAKANQTKVDRFLEKYPDGIHLETKYYHILTTCDEATARELAAKMDAVTRDIYQSIFKFEEKIPYKYIARYYRSEAQYRKEGGPPGSGAFYSPSSKELVGFKKPSSWLREGEDPFKSMYHEGWHQYFDFYIPSAPRWFDEGFAEVISPVEFKGRRAVMRQFNAGRHEYAMQALRYDKLKPLDELIRMSHQEFYQPDVIGIAYAQAWSFMYFLINFKGRTARETAAVRSFYQDYFWELRHGTDPVEAVDKVFRTVRFKTLEAAWLEALPRQNEKRAQ